MMLPFELVSFLRLARKARRLSQLELSLRVGVSQRHVSFVESGRARPSRSLLMGWLHELEVPLATRNTAMLQAGYAPAYSVAPLDDPMLLPANQALSQLLRAHDPMPAMVIDALWNVIDLNRGMKWLAVTLMPWASEMMNGTPVNMLDMLGHPEGFARPILNLQEVGPVMLAHLRQEALAQPALAAKVDAFAQVLRSHLGAQALQVLPQPTVPVMTTRFSTRYGPLAFFSMITTFGTPQNITLASLRVEQMFAADLATVETLNSEVPRA